MRKFLALIVTCLLAESFLVGCQPPEDKSSFVQSPDATNARNPADAGRPVDDTIAPVTYLGGVFSNQSAIVTVPKGALSEGVEAELQIKIKKAPELDNATAEVIEFLGSGDVVVVELIDSNGNLIEELHKPMRISQIVEDESATYRFKFITPARELPDSAIEMKEADAQVESVDSDSYKLMDSRTWTAYLDVWHTSVAFSLFSFDGEQVSPRSSSTDSGKGASSASSADGQDAVDQGAEASGSTSNSSACPTNYVEIPANADLDTAAFCVMKYEAKEFGGRATSQPELDPWTSIARGTDSSVEGSAWKACKDLGTGYDLISNIQWQALARDIESVAANWSNGDPSNNSYLNQGHSDKNPPNNIDAGNGTDPCYKTLDVDCTDNSSSDWTQKRTHTLSNGEIIWDAAGNVWEMVQENYTSQGSNKYVSKLTTELGHDLLRWGPAGDHSSKSLPYYGGLGYGWLNYSGGSVLRGGTWDIGTSIAVVGVFSTLLSVGPSNSSNPTVGFRCVYVSSQ